MYPIYTVILSRLQLQQVIVTFLHNYIHSQLAPCNNVKHINSDPSVSPSAAQILNVYRSPFSNSIWLVYIWCLKHICWLTIYFIQTSTSSFLIQLPREASLPALRFAHLQLTINVTYCLLLRGGAYWVGAGKGGVSQFLPAVSLIQGRAVCAGALNCNS